MVYLPGGPPHLDLVDLKPHAPAEVRGEFRPIPTRVTGMQLCEHLPRLAGLADRLAVIRSVVGCVEEHASHQCLSGYGLGQSRELPGGRPSLGAYLSSLLGPAAPAVPPFVGLAAPMNNMPFADAGDPGFLGRAHAPFAPRGEGLADITLRGITLDRLGDRRALLRS